MPPQLSLEIVNRYVLRRLHVHLEKLSISKSFELPVGPEASVCTDDSPVVSVHEYDAHCRDTEIDHSRAASCVGYEFSVGSWELKARNLSRYAERMGASGIPHWRRNFLSDRPSHSLGFQAAFCDSFKSRLSGDDVTDNDVASSDDFIGEEVIPAKATAETVVTESGSDLIDESEIQGEDVPLEGEMLDEVDATSADSDRQQEVPVSRVAVSQLDYVDVETCSDEDMEETPVAPMVPPVLVTYATGVQWERLKKAETFSYTAELAKNSAEQGEEQPEDLAMSEPRSDPEGRSYLHIMTVDEILHIMEKVRAKDVEVLPVRDLCEWTDHLVFATGRSDKHLRGIADAIVYQVKRRSENVDSNAYPLVEGRDSSSWVVVDCGSVVVHVFEEDARKYYNLENLWRVKRKEALEQ